MAALDGHPRWAAILYHSLLCVAPGNQNMRNLSAGNRVDKCHMPYHKPGGKIRRRENSLAKTHKRFLLKKCDVLRAIRLDEENAIFWEKREKKEVLKPSSLRITDDFHDLGTEFIFNDGSLTQLGIVKVQAYHLDTFVYFQVNYFMPGKS